LVVFAGDKIERPESNSGLKSAANFRNKHENSDVHALVSQMKTSWKKDPPRGRISVLYWRHFSRKNRLKNGGFA
jgi:hypothetical protein